MNRDEAKSILLLYRHGTADADDPQIAAALAVARNDAELADWLEMHCAKQVVLSEKLRRITVPAGLKEQIISERSKKQPVVSENVVPVSFWQRKITPFQLAAVLFLAALLATLWLNRGERDDTLAIYQNQMAGVALRGYGMDVTTNDAVTIRAYLAKNRAPADFVLPRALQQVSLAGCAIEGWQDVKVAMVCFRTSLAAPDASSDLWLFVVNRSAVKKLPAGNEPKFSQVNQMATVTWIEGDKLYLLGMVGDAATLKKYL